MAIKGITIKQKFSKLGNISTQAVKQTISTTKEKITNINLSKSIVTTSPKVIEVATKNSTFKTVSNISTKKQIRIQTPVVIPVPKLVFQIPLIQKEKAIKLTDDMLNVSETSIENNSFVPVEKNGISIFRPEVISILDFKPIWKGFSPQKQDRLLSGFTNVGKLIDFQYNLLWLRRDTLSNLLYSIQNSNFDSTKNTFNQILNEYNVEFDKIERTIKQYVTFLTTVQNVKNSLDIRKIPRSNYPNRSLPLSDFFDSKMQISPKEFEVYSNTKILMQLLFDFKAIIENYSYNLLDLVDADRENDKNPVKIDKTYTLQDGFTFAITQLQSKSTPINALQRSFFNGFLNSLPSNPDDRIKLLTTVLSKEYTISRGLGKNEIQKILQDTFSTTSTGNPFDNIIGIVGDTIFNPPLGEQSLASFLFRRIDNNSFVLPFERKYVDTDAETKQTFIPGSTFYIDTVFNTNNNNFNTEAFTNYVNNFSKKLIDANKTIDSLLELSKETVTTPKRMIDTIYGSYSRAISGTGAISNLNKDQAIIAAIFSLANKNNDLKNLLFQYCLLLGIAQNTPEDRKPIFTHLANELGTIDAFPSISSNIERTVNLRLGSAALNSFITELATKIENKIFSLTTIIPETETEVTLQSKTTFNRFLDANIESGNSSFGKITIKNLTTGQVTINLTKTDIRNLLVVNAGHKSSALTNLITEFIQMSNTFSQGAAINGEELYLLNDGSGRTRFNFVSTSTQLLIIFEILSSMTTKYNFSNFTRSQTAYNSFIIVDTKNNDYIINNINDIIYNKTSGGIFQRINKAISNREYKSPQSFKPFSSPLQKALQNVKTTIKSTSNSSNSTPNTATIGGNFSSLKLDEENLLNTNISSAFLGKAIANKIGLLRINELDLELRTVKLKNSLNSIKNKIIEEKIIKQNILDILSVIEKRLRRGMQEFENTFNQQNLQSFLEENTIQDLKILRNPAQITLIKFLFDEINNKKLSNTQEQNVVISNLNEEQINSNIIINNDIVSQNTKEALYSLLSDNLFLEPNIADLRTKIISVGIPSGFIKQLSDRVEQASIIETSFNEKQFDVISINIFKRDSRHEDIVFKPQSFIFDLSLFEETDLNLYQIERNERFDKILSKIEIKDYEELNSNSTVNKLTIQSIINNPQYNFLSNEQKQNIIKNHFISSLLKVYIKFLTELKIDETTFINNEINLIDFSQSFRDLLFNYLRNDLEKNIPNQSIEELITNPDIDAETKDIIKLLIYGNSTFNPKYLRNLLLTPKMFDKVLHIAFNTEQFEIDVELTGQTQSGKDSLSQLSTQEQILTINDKLYLKAKDRNELAFEDYFITIETDF